MSEAGIFDRPNREDSVFLEAQTVEAAAPQPSQLTESTAVARFEQRIAGGDSRVASTPEGFPRLREADWFSLARKLRQRNRDLLKKVASLEQSLAETQEALHNEVARSRSSDTLNVQQAKDLQTAQEKISTLYRELEASHQTQYQHRTSVAQLSDQLEEATQRIAELDRECAVWQQRYHEQSQDLEAAQQKTSELSARLERQQRRTLQFKAALDRCLEEAARTLRPERARLLDSERSHGFQVENDSRGPAHLRPTPVGSEAGVSHTQPIQPWSYRETPCEALSDRRPLWAHKTLDSERALAPAEPDGDGAPALAPEVFELPPQIAPPFTPDERLASDSLSFESFERLQPIEWEIEPSDTDTFDAIFERVELVAAEPTPEETLNQQPVSTEETSTTEGERDRLLPFPSPTARNLEAVAPPQSNFPAPLVYPHRTQRKHQSLASIELPRFLD
jgi:hypothetical protein